MPDLTVQYYYHCQSCEHFSTQVEGSKGKQHTVSYGATPRGHYQYDYHCTCDAFKFRKTCKHIEQVKASNKHCNWNQFLEGDEPVDVNGKKCCPRCGGDVFSQGYGV